MFTVRIGKFLVDVAGDPPRFRVNAGWLDGDTPLEFADMDREDLDHLITALATIRNFQDGRAA